MLAFLLFLTVTLGAPLPGGVPSAPDAAPRDPVQAPSAEQEARSEVAIAYARSKLGEPYRWEGRGTSKYPDWDCLGILFRAYSKATGRPWWTYEVNPSELVANGKLGVPVPGVHGVLREEVVLAQLMPGDVLYFLKPDYRIPDAPLMTRDGVDWWPWHTGMYIGDGKALHAEPGGVVRVQELVDISWDGLLATRLP